MGATPEPAGVADVEALAVAHEARRQCALGFHAWTPWLAVHRGGMEANGISFYHTWCAREGCNHAESWDCP